MDDLKNYVLEEKQSDRELTSEGIWLMIKKLMGQSSELCNGKKKK